MRLQPHYYCHRAPRARRKGGVRQGDVKACYVRIRRRRTRIGTFSLHCRRFAPELRHPLKYTNNKAIIRLKRN